MAATTPPGPEELAQKIAAIPGAVESVHDAPGHQRAIFQGSRSTAPGPEEVGLNQSGVASNLLISLSGSGQAAPNFWLNPETGVQYSVVTQTPQFRIDSLNSLLNTPIGTGRAGGIPQILGNVATVERINSPAVVSHYDVQPVFDIYANVDGRDLGSVAAGVRRLVKEYEPKVPRGSYITLTVARVQSMDDVLPRPRGRHRRGHRPRLPPDGGEFPVLARISFITTHHGAP